MGKDSSKDTYVLVESPAGYCVALVKEWDSVNPDTFCEEFKDPSKFSKVVRAKGFYPFANSDIALANMEAVASGKASEDLINFLNQSLPSKKRKYQLGVIDSELAKSLVNSIADINVIHGRDVFEVMRACRMNVDKLNESLESKMLHKLHLGLGHSFSRKKIASDPAKQDKHCSQAIATIELCEKTINKFAMRLREWYGWHFPELNNIVPDNKKYAEIVLCIGVRENCSFEDKRSELMAVLDQNSDLVDQISVALKMSMGYEICDADWSNISEAAQQVISWSTMRATVGSYLSDKMEIVAPNIKALVGDNLGCKLISQSGSVNNLAKSPASTIQILGAEKALFRALKSRGPTPKYGLIYHSSFLGRAGTKNKGRISRFLANKLALAARMDAFGERTGTYGTAFREQVEERLRFLSDGVVPRKNLDVVRQAAIDSATVIASMPDEVKPTSAGEADVVIKTARDSKKEKKDRKEKKDKPAAAEVSEKKVKKDKKITSEDASVSRVPESKEKKDVKSKTTSSGASAASEGNIETPKCVNLEDSAVRQKKSKKEKQRHLEDTEQEEAEVAVKKSKRRRPEETVPEEAHLAEKQDSQSGSEAAIPRESHKKVKTAGSDKKDKKDKPSDVKKVKKASKKSIV